MASKEKDYAPHWPENKRIPHKHIEFGSPEHAALLGMPDEVTAATMTAEERAGKQRLLEQGPIIACPESKVPINKRNYQVDEEIFDGWMRYGSR